MGFKKTAADETFGYPDFAVEAALLDRSLIIEGTKEEGELSTLGGHLIFLHTPHVHQHLEGALLQNMGQQGRLGRYPLHFHMSESVHHSTLAKNVIWKSNQRCIVIHGTHNATVSDNVAYDTQGHCFMLEDGGEYDNTFEYNLGAKTRALPANTPQAGETDNRPSTFWITNPSNNFIGNVAAGSAANGFWFELMLRGPSASLPINEGANPKTMAQGVFEDNVAHSNNFRAGFTTYETGYRAPPGTTWKNIKSFKNRNSGLFQHGTTNIYLEGGLLADNGQAARNFHHDSATYDGVEVIGRSQHVQALINEGRLSDDCRVGGISVQPNEGMGAGTVIKSSVFSGFDNECNTGPGKAIYIENDQVRNAVFDSSPTIFGNTFDSPNKRISACMSINSSPDGWVRLIAIEDIDGSLSGVEPGFFVQDEPAITNFIDASSCQSIDESCLLFCPNTCLRLGIISISQDKTTRGFVMTITDGATSAVVERRSIWFDELQNHLSAQMPIVLPAALTGRFQISFTDQNGVSAWPGYATLSLERAPIGCTGGVVSDQIELVMPSAETVVQGRCDNLFKYDDYENGIHGWQNFFSGISVSQDADGEYVITTTRRKNDRGHVNLSRTLDASCFAHNSGRSFRLFGSIRMQDTQGMDVASDGTSNLSPRIRLIVNAGNAALISKTWNIATASDGSWSDFDTEITLPADSSTATKAIIYIDMAEKREFLIKNWGMTLIPTIPTESPTPNPSSLPSAIPSFSPSAIPSFSPSAVSSVSMKPVTVAPTQAPVTAAPVPAAPVNLALNGLASAKTECWNGWARKIIDGNPSSINHSCCGQYGQWVMVDLGKDTLNYVDNIVIKNRADCCGGRLKLFYVEVLDEAKNVLWQTYHPGSVGNGVVKTFTVNDGTLGRFVRVRHEDTHKDCFHIAELEVWGYPVSLPATQPEIIEMALNQPADASSSFNLNTVASKSVDGNLNSIHHSNCKDFPWWLVDLGVESFIQDVWITNRVDCCGGRLRQAEVAILDENQNVVESRWIEGSVGNGQQPQIVFNEDTSIGRYVKVSFSRADCLHMAEVNVNGYHLMAKPTTSPTGTLTNVALGLTDAVQQSSTFQNNDRDAAHQAVDGNRNTFTHTNCQDQGWWKIDLGRLWTIEKIVLGNRLDCCGGRLREFHIRFFDNQDAEISDEAIYVPYTVGAEGTFDVPGVVAQHVKINLNRNDCLQLGEVEVYAY
jgi:hypothetical protein